MVSNRRRSRTQELQTIAEIARILASAVNVEEVYPRFAETVGRALPVDRLSASRLTDGGDALVVEFLFGEGVVSPRGGEYPVEGSAAGYVALSGRPVVIGDLTLTRRFPHLEIFASEGMRSACFLPLVAGGRHVGVLGLMSRQHQAYRRAHLRFLEEVSTLLAHAVQNTRLFLQVRRLAQAIAATGEAITVTDKDANVLFANPALARLLGYGADELVGQPVAKLYAGGWNDPTLRAIIASLTQHGKWSGMADLKAKNGSLIATRETATCLYDDSGQHIGFVCINADDRERRQAEDLLREREELYRGISENLREGISISTDGAQVFVNSTFLHLVGATSADDVLGKPVEPLLSEDLAPGAFLQQLPTEAGPRTDQPQEFIRRLPDGTLRVLHCNADEITYRGRKALLVVVQDQTRSHFRSIERNTVFQCAEALVRTGSFHDLASAVISIVAKGFGLEHGTLALADDQGVLHLTNTLRALPNAPAWTPAIGTAVTRTAYTTGREVVTNDYPNHPNARPEIISLGVKSLGAFPLRVGSTTVGALTLSTEKAAFFNDQILQSIKNVADEVASLLQNALLQERVRQEQSLKERADTFVSIASHELRTPLTLMMGYSELLLRKEIPESLKQNAVEHIYQGSARLMSIINDMLDVSRIHSGRILVSPNWISLHSATESAVGAVKPLATKHRLSNEVPSRLPKVWADENKVVQVLTNLLQNAVKYSPNGGTVRITAREEDGGRAVIVGVHDEGIGISPEDQAKLFRSFSRIKRPETERIGGVGLGLYIASSLLEVMNGRIWVESALNEGSTFYFSLPTYAATAPEPALGPSESNTDFPPDAS